MDNTLPNIDSQQSLENEKNIEIDKYLELAKAYEKLEELKTKEDVMDFADLVSNTLLLFRKRKNVLKRYQNQFKYILIDEFQDTNFAQNELGILLAGEKKNITVVADDDQAIYRWRGAALSNVIQFKNNFPGTKIITLTRNYRSTQEILDRSYQLIQNNNPNRLETLENINKKLTSERKVKGKSTEFIHAKRADQEADEIAKKIKSIIKNSDYKYSDIAVLVRANSHAQSVTCALSRNRIPYQFLGPGQLFQQEEIKDLIAYLKTLYNLEDTISLFRVLNMDIFNLSSIDINYLMNFARKRNLPLFAAMEQINETFLSDKSKLQIKKITDMIKRHLDRIKKDTAGQILYYFLVDTGLYNRFIGSNNPEEEQKVQNVAKLFDRIKTFESINPDASVYAVVDWIDLMMQLGDSPLVEEVDWKDINAVNILTIHSAKGLEFPVVFMVNLVSDRFPTRERKEKIPIPADLIKEILPLADYHMQEERRLFYVGMTRARDLLYFTAADFYSEARRQKKISPFVLEALPQLSIDQNLLKQPTQLSLIELTKDYREQEEEKEEKKPNPHRITYLSYSHIQAFDICPLHYKARYMLNLPTPPSAALSFGISIHETLQDLYTNLKHGKVLSKTQVIELLKNNWRTEGYQEKAHEREMFIKGEELLKYYLKKNFNPKTVPLSLELPFSFYISRKDKDFSDPDSLIKIAGKIDRIDKNGKNGIEIIDYKTGKSDGMSKYSYQLQLGIYALAATRVDNEFLKKRPEDITITLFYVEDDKKLTSKIRAEDIIQTEKQLIEKVTEIENSDFSCSKSILCADCEYKMLCNINV